MHGACRKAPGKENMTAEIRNRIGAAANGAAGESGREADSHMAAGVYGSAEEAQIPGTTGAGDAGRTALHADLQAFRRYLQLCERSEATIEKYLHDVGTLIDFLDDQALTQETALSWKHSLLESGMAPSTINVRIAAANSFFVCLGFPIHLTSVRRQRRMFRSEEKDLSRAEYRRLVKTARETGKVRLMLLFETICATGIRVSEIRNITCEAVQAGSAQIRMKGKIRVILIPQSLCRKLLDYAKRQGITSGEIFITKNGRGMSRGQIWAEMKAVCAGAGVAPEKVFPHNLRHLFARIFYDATHDVVKLADVLGHSDLSTTRIYLISTGEEHRRQLETLRLVS